MHNLSAPPLSSAIAERVAKRRAFAISVTALAAHAGISRQSCYSIEAGNTTVSAELVQAYCDTVDVLAKRIEVARAALDQLAVDGVRPMTPAELRGAVTGGDV